MKPVTIKADEAKAALLVDALDNYVLWLNQRYQAGKLSKEGFEAKTMAINALRTTITSRARQAGWESVF